MTIRSVIIACMLFSSVCYADTIATDPIPPYWYSTGFGSSEVYRGQTFRLPSGPAVLANDLTVFMGPQTHSGARFRLLITEVDTFEGLHPTDVIFESETVNVQFSFNSKSYDVELGGLLLQPEHDYAWIMDYFAVRNPSDDPIDRVNMSVGLGSYPSDMGQGNYPDGVAFSFFNGPFYPSGTRQDHFASNNWGVQENRDFAFQLDFTPIPEPASLSLLGLVTGGLWFVRRFFMV